MHDGCGCFPETGSPFQRIDCAAKRMGASMTRKVLIEIFKGGGTHPWHFRMVALNGQKFTASEGYTRKQDAIRAAKRLPAQIAAAEIVVID
jgi:uncharacterized protein YegP (UPF0339 family)